jgi:hypothetical protein
MPFTAMAHSPKYKLSSRISYVGQRRTSSQVVVKPPNETLYGVETATVHIPTTSHTPSGLNPTFVDGSSMGK